MTLSEADRERVDAELRLFRRVLQWTFIAAVLIVAAVSRL